MWDIGNLSNTTNNKNISMLNYYWRLLRKISSIYWEKGSLIQVSTVQAQATQKRDS